MSGHRTVRRGAQRVTTSEAVRLVCYLCGYATRASRSNTRNGVTITAAVQTGLHILCKLGVGRFRPSSRSSRRAINTSTSWHSVRNLIVYNSCLRCNVFAPLRCDCRLADSHTKRRTNGAITCIVSAVSLSDVTTARTVGLVVHLRRNTPGTRCGYTRYRAAGTSAIQTSVNVLRKLRIRGTPTTTCTTCCAVNTSLSWHSSK